MATTAADAESYHVEIRRVKRPLARPLQTGGGRSIDVRESVLLKVTAMADAARNGYGEAATLPWFGTENADQAAAALTALGSKLVLCPLTANTPCPQNTAQTQANCQTIPTAIPPAATIAVARADRLPPKAEPATGKPSPKSHWQDALEQRLPADIANALATAPCARWALECALRQAGGLPPLRCHTDDSAHSGIPVAALLPQGGGQILQDLLTAGFTTFKIKVGVRPFAEEAASTTQLLTSLAAQHGAQRLRLRLDANGSLNNGTLQQWLHLLSPFAANVDFIEQPLPPGQEQQTADAFAGSPLRFALDESLTSLPRLLHTAAQFPQAVLVVKPSLLGSAEAFLRWRRQDAATGAPRHIVYSSALETGIGIDHALCLAAADPLPLEPVGFGTASLFAADGLGAPQRTAQILPDCPADNSSATQALRNKMEAVWKLA